MTAELRLFLEILFVSTFLMGILLVNNIFLYKQKLTDIISLMLIFGIASCLFEIAWTILDGHFRLKALTYLSTCLYCATLFAFGIFFNRYLLGRLGVRLKKSWMMIIYGLPTMALLLICITTPWTRLLFWVDESGVVQTMLLFNTAFEDTVYLYVFSPLLVAIFFLTLGKDKRPADCKISKSMFAFAIIAPVIYWVQLTLLGDGMDAYETTSMPLSLALVYLITNESTNAALETRAKMEAVESDLRFASKIQLDALPPVAPEFPDHPNVNLRASMNTAKEVGGDFFDYFSIDDDRICFLIADVSGKGTPAALFMMTAKTMIKDYALTQGSTSEIFTAVNARLCENNEAGMFATAWIGILDTRTMTLQYTNAGHNYPVLQRRDQPCEEMKKVHGLFLGGMEFTQYRQDELQLNPGDRLLLYTDGVVEAHDQKNELYGEDRLKAVLEDTRECPGEQVLARVFEDVNAYATGVLQFDDITMVVLTIK